MLFVIQYDFCQEVGLVERVDDMFYTGDVQYCSTIRFQLQPPTVILH